MAKRRSPRVPPTIPKPIVPIDWRDEVSSISATLVALRIGNAHDLALKIFGVQTEPYVGFEDLTGLLAPWNRICVDIEGLPPLGYNHGLIRDFDRGGSTESRFRIWSLCAVCEDLSFVSFEDLVVLATITEAPLRGCQLCEKVGRITMQNILTGDLVPNLVNVEVLA